MKMRYLVIPALAVCGLVLFLKLGDQSSLQATTAITHQPQIIPALPKADSADGKIDVIYQGATPAMKKPE